MMMGGVIEHRRIRPCAKDLLPIGYLNNLLGVVCLAEGHREVNLAFG